MSSDTFSTSTFGLLCCTILHVYSPIGGVSEVIDSSSILMESSSAETRERSSSPTGERRPVSPHSSASSSSTSSVITGTMMNVVRPSSSSASSIRNIGEGLESRSVSLSRSQSESIDIGLRAYGGQIQSGMGSGELLSEGIDVPSAGDSISVTIRFRPLR